MNLSFKYILEEIEKYYLRVSLMKTVILILILFRKYYVILRRKI